MGVKEKVLTAVDSITSGDFLRVVTSAGYARKIDYNKLAKAIVENYAGSSLAGSSQSLKAAIDSLNSKKLSRTFSCQSSTTLSFVGYGVKVKANSSFCLNFHLIYDTHEPREIAISTSSSSVQIYNTYARSDNVAIVSCCGYTEYDLPLNIFGRWSGEGRQSVMIDGFIIGDYELITP